jgi:hypothetical protein
MRETPQPTSDLPVDEPSVNGSEPSAPVAPAPPGFDYEKFRIGSIADVAVEKVLTMVPVRKPNRREFFRVHPDPAFTMDTLLLERDDGMDRESYLIAPEIQHLVLPELHRVRLFTAITKRGTVFLWPVKLPLEGNDRLRRQSDTALVGAERAKKLWVRLVWSRELGGYEMYLAKGDLGQPQWDPNRSFGDLVEIAFRHNIIAHADHDVIKELEGEM